MVYESLACGTYTIKVHVQTHNKPRSEGWSGFFSAIMVPIKDVWGDNGWLV
jgi:hypothetical protein